MSSAGKQREHPEGVVGISGFAEDPVLKLDHGIRTDDQILREAGRNLIGFPECIIQCEHHPGAFFELFRR